MIIVDAFSRAHGPRDHMHWCPMISDVIGPEGIDELHAMAERIGLKRDRFQGAPRYSVPHYDLTPSKRALALKAGAVDDSSDRNRALIAKQNWMRWQREQDRLAQEVQA